MEVRRWLAWPKGWRQRYYRWLDRRIPPNSTVKLTQRNLFIFLSRHGFYFLLLDALLWIGATNFQNNLAYALSFFLLAVLFVSILQTFANVSGLQLRFVDADSVFAGEVMRAKLLLTTSTPRQQLILQWPDQPPVTTSVWMNVPNTVYVSHATFQRGWLRPGRLRLQSVYPLGLVRCWSWLDLDVRCLVYPAQIEADYRSCSRGNDEQGALELVRGGEDFFSLKPYVTGDSYVRVAWKQFAAGRGLFVHEYAHSLGGDVMLDFSCMTDPDIEVRLSKLCYCACRLHEQGRVFGLLLPGYPAIAPALGETHWRAVMAALALYSV